MEYGIIWLDESQNVKTPEDAIGYLSEYGKYIGITENYYYWNLENLHIEVGTNDNDVLYILFERPGLDESEDDMPKGAIEITSIDLLAAYEENAVGADMKYLDKLLAVTGEIGSIDTDFLGDPYVTLTDGERFSLSSVQCYFNDAYITDIGSLKKGENITIIGYCDGKSLNVQMKECYLAD